MQATTIIQVTREDLQQFAADAYAAGYEKAYAETHEKMIQAKTIAEMGRKIGASRYKICQMLQAGEITRTLNGYQTK